MPKQTDFITQIQSAQKRVAAAQTLVDESTHLFEQSVKNNMVHAADRLKGQLKRQTDALRKAKAELAEWEKQK